MPRSEHRSQDEPAPRREPEPFSRFMERALYHPERGYYTQNVRAIGRGGDFTTSPALSTSLGRAILHWVNAENLWHDEPIRHLIEVGAGGGHLMQSLLRARGWKRFFSKGMRHHIVDRSPTLIAQQKKRLGSRQVQWHADLPSALHACGGEAIIISNELPDAFPITLLQWDAAQGRWMEICIADGAEQLRPFDTQAGLGCSAIDTWNAATPPPRKNQRIELGLAYRDWMSDWLPLLKAGSLLTIDYGDLFPSLYERNPTGTLRAYFHQQRLTGEECYNNPGHQDLTSDVNFTDLQTWGEEAGLITSGFSNQREFLEKHLSGAEIDDPDAFSFLTSPQGAGEAFKALQQRRPRA